MLPLSIAILLMAEPVPAADLNVLILHSYHQEYLWTKKENDGFVKTLQARFAGKELAFSSEYLDTKRIPFTDEYQDFFKQYLQQKYLHTHMNAKNVLVIE